MSARRRAEGAVFVSGGQGFVGSWLVERLLDDDALVVVPHRRVRHGSRFQERRLAERCDAVDVDLLHPSSVARALEEHDVELVFHLAAETTVGTASRCPLPAFETNVRATYNVLEACRTGQLQGRRRRVVIASSSHVYGDQGQSNYTEDLALSPSRPYDVSKACTDMLARSYAKTFEMPVAVTRMANLYGGGDLNFSRLVPAAARALVGGERPAIRSDGTSERDYLYVEDAVEAYLRVARSLEGRALWGRAWNVAADSPVAVRDLVARLIGVSGAGVESEVRVEDSGPAEQRRRHVDSSAIREELGWAPAWDLDDGLRETYAWYEGRLR